MTDLLKFDKKKLEQIVYPTMIYRRFSDDDLLRRKYYCPSEMFNPEEFI